jgi:Glyoxalase/Bleomycin resistance protein/Dioxygenase superfamily
MSHIFGPIRQLGYVVHDIEDAMRRWSQTYGIGPFFYFEKAVMRDFRYIGEPYPIALSIAIVNSGDLQIELIQQRNDVPSMYRDHLATHGECLHHVSSWTTNYEADLKKILAAGHEIGQEARIGSSRLAYFKYNSAIPTVFEIYDVSGKAGVLNDQVREAALSWDGSDPIRRL